MMTWETGRPSYCKNSSSAGFTLLEMIVVLAIIGLFTGLVVVGFGRGEPEVHLTDASNGIRKAAHQASHLASLYHRDFFVFFDKNSFRVSDSDVSKIDPFSRTGSRQIASFPIPDDVAIELRLADERRWSPAKGYSWRFRGSGLCDPVNVRFRYDRSFIELNFNVLTARADETSFFQ